MESVEHFENISYSNSCLAIFSYIKMLKLMTIDKKKICYMLLEVCENSTCYIRLLGRLAVVWSTVAWLVLTISRYYGHFYEIFMIGAYEKSHPSMAGIN